MKYVSLWILGLCFAPLFLFSACKSVNVLELRSAKDMKVNIITFSDFKKDTLKLGVIKQDITQKIHLDYQGFALMVIDDKYPYPLVLGRDAVKINFSKAEEAPVFEQCPENTFFYDYFGKYNQLGSRIYQLHDAQQALGEKDPFYPEIVQRVAEINDEKEEMRNSLPNPEFPLASAILLEKQWEEKSYSIKTLEELHEMQQKFVNFVKKNYALLQHSDRLTAIINQSYMMLEYVNFFEDLDDIQDKKLLSQKANNLFRNEVMRQTQMWLETFQDYLPGNTVLSACVSAYYNRGMVGKAYEIVMQFQDKAFCEGGQKQLPLPIPKDFDIVKSDGITPFKARALHSDKFLMVVDDECVFSKIFAVIKARELEKDSRQLIILPKGNLNKSILSMDKLCVKDLFFVKDKSPFNIPDMDLLSAPSMYILDANNNLKK